MKFRIVFLALSFFYSNGFADIPCDLVRKDPSYSIGYLKTGKGFCSGILLSPHLVLTAGHCVKDQDARMLFFSLVQAKFSPVAQAVVHPTYWRARDGSAGGADLAVLVLKDTQYGRVPDYFLPFRSSSAFESGTKLTSYGFGLQDDGKASRRHKKTVLFSEKADTLAADGKTLKNARLVLKRGDTGELQCSGDSGGPVLQEENGRWTLVGINSRSAASIKYSSSASLKRKLASKEYFCQHADKFMAVALSEFAGWIQEKMDSLESDKAKPRCAP